MIKEKNYRFSLSVVSCYIKHFMVVLFLSLNSEATIGQRGQKSSDERVKRKHKLFVRMKMNVNSQCGRH